MKYTNCNPGCQNIFKICAEFQRWNPVYIESIKHVNMINGTKILIVEIIECKIKILRECLFRTAMGDGILSNTEINILFSIDLNLDLLHYAVICAYDDNVIDENEINEFDRIITQIEDDAVSVAKFDDCITHEDKILIHLLQILLIDFQKVLLR